MMNDDEVSLVYNVSTGMNGLSIFFAALGITIYGFMKFKGGLKETLQMRLGLYLLMTDVLYSMFQIVSNIYQNDDWFCIFGNWGYTFTTDLLVFYNVAIAHNVHYSVLLGRVKNQQSWERIYAFGPIVAALILSLIPFTTKTYAYVPDSLFCWYDGPLRIGMEWACMIGWVAAGIVYSVAVIAAVIIRVKGIADRSTKDESSMGTVTKSSVAGSQTFTKSTASAFTSNTKIAENGGGDGTTMKRNKAGKLKSQRNIARKIFNILAPYPMILLVCQITVVIDMWYLFNMRTIGYAMFDYCISACPGIFHFILIMRNPNLLNMNSTNLETFQIILRNPKLSSIFYDFLKTILCEENLEFYFLVEKFKSTYDMELQAGKGEFTESLEIRNKIRDTYFGNETLNLPAGMIAEMKGLLAKPDYLEDDMFDKCSEHAKNMIFTDSLPKFMKSDKYKEAEEIIRIERVQSKL